MAKPGKPLLRFFRRSRSVQALAEIEAELLDLAGFVGASLTAARRLAMDLSQASDALEGRTEWLKRQIALCLAEGHQDAALSLAAEVEDMHAQRECLRSHAQSAGNLSAHLEEYRRRRSEVIRVRAENALGVLSEDRAAVWRARLAEIFESMEVPFREGAPESETGLDTSARQEICKEGDLSEVLLAMEARDRRARELVEAVREQDGRKS